MYLPEMSQNVEVMEVFHELANTYPDIELMGRFLNEIEADTSGSLIQKRVKAKATDGGRDCNGDRQVCL